LTVDPYYDLQQKEQECVPLFIQELWFSSSCSDAGFGSNGTNENSNSNIEDELLLCDSPIIYGSTKSEVVEIEI
jgi:hypothetical protein